MKHNSVKTDDIFTIKALFTAFTQRFDSSYTFSGEFHNFREIVIVTDGKLGVTAGSDVFVLQKGQAIIHDPMEFHNLWSEGETTPEIIIFSFADSNFPQYTSKILSIPDLTTPFQILQQLHNAFILENHSIFTAVKTPNGTDHHLAIKALEHYILTLLRESSHNNHLLKTRSAQLFTKAVTVMEENIEQSLSVSDIARLCNAGEVNLKKIFSKYSGMGIMTYFNKMKITEALKMLENGFNINETSAALGFSNQNYFSTVFKRITGHPPSYYK